MRLFALLSLAALLPARAAKAQHLVVPPGLRVKLLDEGAPNHGIRRFMLVFDPGAEVVSVLSDFVLKNHFASATFTAIGACTDATIAYWDPQDRTYHKTPYHQQMEIVSLIGDLAPMGDKAGFHGHIGLGLSDGTMRGGHLLEAHASPTLELTLVVSSVAMHRQHDERFNAELLVP